MNRAKVLRLRAARGLCARPVEIDVARQKILMLGEQIGFVEIGQARHRSHSFLPDELTITKPCRGKLRLTAGQTLPA